MSQRKALISSLRALENELRCLGLWQDETPHASQLASSLPFAADTLELHQWLQYVFIPRMNHLINTHSALPPTCDIRSYAEQVYLHNLPAYNNLLAILARVDSLVIESSTML